MNFLWKHFPLFSFLHQVYISNSSNKYNFCFSRGIFVLHYGFPLVYSTLKFYHGYLSILHQAEQCPSPKVLILALKFLYLIWLSDILCFTTPGSPQLPVFCYSNFWPFIISSLLFFQILLANSSRVQIRINTLPKTLYKISVSLFTLFRLLSSSVLSYSQIFGCCTLRPSSESVYFIYEMRYCSCLLQESLD